MYTTYFNICFHPLIWLLFAAESTKLDDLDPDLTADQFIEKIMLVEEMQKFTFRKWYNDIDQEIFVYGSDDGSMKIADLLWVHDFSEWYTIAVRHKTARGKSPSTSSKASFLVQSMFDSVRKKYTLMNTIHKKLFFEVRYAAESQE